MAWKRPDNYDGVPENIEDYAPGRAAGRCFMGWSHEEDPVLESLRKKDTLAMNREAVKWAREGRAYGFWPTISSVPRRKPTESLEPLA